MPPSLAHGLVERLAAAGIAFDPAGDPAAAWARLSAHEGPRATLVDRYELEAAARGIPVSELDAHLRTALAREVLSARDPGFEIVPGSERARADPVEIVEYDPRWPDRFQTWRRRLTPAIGSAARRIEHIGSTSVPGLIAKPVIDILVSVPDVADDADYVRAIEELGVALRARETGHRYFRPAGEAGRDVQIHVWSEGSTGEREHLLFRDYLRADDSAAAAYGALKQRIADEFRDDRIAYNEAKSGWILDALAAAEGWAVRTGWHL